MLIDLDFEEFERLENILKNKFELLTIMIKHGRGLQIRRIKLEYRFYGKRYYWFLTFDCRRLEWNFFLKIGNSISSSDV